jgi:hypothetical protein
MMQNMRMSISAELEEDDEEEIGEPLEKFVRRRLFGLSTRKMKCSENWMKFENEDVVELPDGSAVSPIEEGLEAE